MNILDKIKKIISSYNMVAERDKILVAVSGGPDSVCLLDILNRLAPEYKLKLYMAHLNHGLRDKESDREQMFCQILAREMGIPFITKKAKLKKEKGSLEEKARRIRYQFLEDSAGKIGAGKIALGHNADDQAETVLMRLIRGAGARGMSGIPPVRKTKGGLTVIRPLIGITRNEILEYLGERRLDYCEDSSNSQLIFFRNKIRHRLMPLLAGYNPGIKRILQATGTNMALIDDYMQKQAEKEFSRIAVVWPKKIWLNINKIKKLHRAVQKELIRKAVISLEPELIPDTAAVDNILALSERCWGSKRINLSRKIKVIREYDMLVVSKPSGSDSRYSKKLMVPGETVVDGDKILISSRLYHKDEITRRVWKTAERNIFEVYLDYDRIPKPLSIRTWRPGDKFHPLGLTGTKKVQDIFTDAKIPVRLRKKVPLLVSGQDICWIAGYRIGNKFKITSKTKRILGISIKGMDEIWPI